MTAGPWDRYPFSPDLTDDTVEVAVPDEVARAFLDAARLGPELSSPMRLMFGEHDLGSWRVEEIRPVTSRAYSARYVAQLRRVERH